MVVTIIGEIVQNVQNKIKKDTKQITKFKSFHVCLSTKSTSTFFIFFFLIRPFLNLLVFKVLFFNGY